MTEIITSIILYNYKCPSWNTLYAGKHWAVRQEMAEYAHQSIKEEHIKFPWKDYTAPVRILVIAHLKRPIDCDNVCAKLLIDGLKLVGTIKEDSPKYVTEVTTRVVKSKTDYTVIEIYEGIHTT